MKTWLIVVCVVAVLLAASTGAGFWMLSDTRAQLASTEAELVSAETELVSTEAELVSTEAELTDTNETLEDARARMEILAGIFLPVITGELDQMTEAEIINWFVEWRDQILAIGDPILEAKFQAAVDSLHEADLMSFFVYLFDSMAEVLD